MPSVNAGSKYRTETVLLNATSEITVYTVPATFASHVEHFFVGNSHSGNVTLRLDWYHADSTTEYTIMSGYTIAGGAIASIFTVDKPLFLHAGDILKCTANTADVLSVTVSAEEFLDPTRG
jgi:hypothetical protein